MKMQSGEIRLSSRDLTGYLSCRHLTQLDLQAVTGAIERPSPWDPSLEALWERGFRHELDYVDHLTAQNFTVIRIDGVNVDDAAVEATLTAMRSGADVIVQAALRNGSWIGRADVLRRVETQSEIGAWSYEVYDTKLGRETKASTVLQLCLYSELLGYMQGAQPEHMHVVAPWTNFLPQQYRVAEYAAYFRLVRQSLVFAVTDKGSTTTYPEPTAHCDICVWRTPCDARRRADDHLSLVAGISSLQMAELVKRGITTLATLAEMPLPMQWQPERGSQQSFERVREQARLQLETRTAGKLLFETIPVEAGFGLAALPAPSAGDVYLDFEGDSFVGEHGQEYLLGYHYACTDGEWRYIGLWGLTREDEKRAFEQFIDFIIERWAAHPDLHIYHYGGYEPGALKRLMGRYATREEELDSILRGRLLVDLLTVVRQGIRAGLESYSIKHLEPLYAFERRTDLPDANLALTRLQTGLELGDLDSVPAEDHVTIESYNRDDCVSTRYLHYWLEGQRSELIANGTEISRPLPGDASPSENIADWVVRITPLVNALSAGVPADPIERSPEQHGKWLLANMLDFHRREEKANWWEYFRLAALPAENLIDEKAGLGGLSFVGTVGGTTRCPIHRYSFSPQETDARPGKSLRNAGGVAVGSIEAIDADALTIDIKKSQQAAQMNLEAVFVHEHVGSEPMKEALVRLAEHVVQNGLEGEGQHRAARDLLLKRPPRLATGESLRCEGETTLDAALRVAAVLEPGVLPVQGPPGAGKTYTGARMICELVRSGRRVGIVANSHAVIRNLLDEVIKAADAHGVDLQCVQKPKEREPHGHRLRIATKSSDLFAALASDCHVAGGTAWLWSTPEAFQSVDILFVDEAAQMSLANVLAVSQAARALVLLGDPRQLDQPMQGSHPEGTDKSALDHILDGRQTIAPEQGLFLEETWRLHPEICAFTSELFYESKLRSRENLDRQAIRNGPASGSGLRFLPVQHIGNHNSSLEEVEEVENLVQTILSSNSHWIDRHGVEHKIALNDVLIIAPYNAQVYELQQKLPVGARIGTVDKFQGQEAPIAIYSLATSSYAEAPRGMEFLYSLNRLNVATSRARCVSYLVCSPQIFEAKCRNPRQMMLANAFCRFLEMAQHDS